MKPVSPHRQNGILSTFQVTALQAISIFLISWRRTIGANGAGGTRGRRVPVLLQLTRAECAAACLAMVLSTFGRATRVAECRTLLDAGRDGVTARAIVEAARSFGLHARGLAVPPTRFAHTPLPAIAHWEASHFVVVENWSQKYVTIVDPALGRRRLSHDAFAAGYSGVALVFERGSGFQPRRAAVRPPWSSYTRNVLRLAGVPMGLAQVLGASLLLQLLGLALPLFVALLVDRVLPLGAYDILPLLGLGMVTAVLAQAGAGYLRAVLLISLQTRLDALLTRRFVAHLLSLPFPFFQARSSGDLLMRLSSNTTIREMLTTQMIAMLLDGGLVLVYLAILLARAPTFGALVAVFGLLQVAIPWVARGRVQALERLDLSARAEEKGHLVEALSGIVTLKSAGLEVRALEHWSVFFGKAVDLDRQRGRLSALVGATSGLFAGLAPLLLLWLGARAVLDGALSVGEMLALVVLASSCLAPLAGLANTARQLQVVGAHLERLADVLEARPEQDASLVQTPARLSGRIDLREVGFRYSSQGRPALRDITLAIRPGQRVAIVGRTGSGKTTLARLLLGLYQPTQGEIRYDGLPLAHLDYAALRRQIGVVPQEVHLFDGTIRDNIAARDPSVPMDRVVRAARLAEMHDEIAGMPIGYETRVGEGGRALSGGQRQRIALARALVHEPAILLLDEATSHVDTATEGRILENLRALACTSVVIAHRTSTIRDADLILVLENGSIVEKGGHAELLARGGAYARLMMEGQHGRSDHFVRAPEPRSSADRAGLEGRCLPAGAAGQPQAGPGTGVWHACAGGDRHPRAGGDA